MTNTPKPLYETLSLLPRPYLLTFDRRVSQDCCMACRLGFRRLRPRPDLVPPYPVSSTAIDRTALRPVSWISSTSSSSEENPSPTTIGLTQSCPLPRGLPERAIFCRNGTISKAKRFTCISFKTRYYHAYLGMHMNAASASELRGRI